MTISPRGRCISCGEQKIEILLDLGPQPPSNRFYSAGERQSDAHPLVVAQCVKCALLQLVNPMPEEMVRPHHEWITYNEPETHLDSLVAELVKSLGLTESARIVGLSYKDDTTLARFNARGFTDTYRFAMESDLGITEAFAGLETLQLVFNPALADALVDRYGQADVFVVRHVLEHAHDPGTFLQAVSRLVKPGGVAVLETPGSEKFLNACDYSFLWEEHTAYFTKTTIRRVVAAAGLQSWRILNYEYALEDSLIAVVRPFPGTATLEKPTETELDLGRGYGAGFDRVRVKTREALLRLGAEGRRTAVFGAGHLAAKFLNFFELGDLVQCVVDDNPHKLGLSMPGSGLEVRPSSVLMKDGIDLCLTTLSPESEKKVIASQQAYLAQGGEFRSIFPLSPIAFQKVAT